MEVESQVGGLLFRWEENGNLSGFTGDDVPIFLRFRRPLPATGLDILFGR